MANILVNPAKSSFTYPLPPFILRGLMAPDANIEQVKDHGSNPENIDRMLLTLFTEANTAPRKPLYAEVEVTEKGTVRLVVSREKGEAVLTPAAMQDLYAIFRNSPTPGRLMDTVIQTGRAPYIEKMEKLDLERMRAAMAEGLRAFQNRSDR